jgi:serine/threonine protein kinase
MCDIILGHPPKSDVDMKRSNQNRSRIRRAPSLAEATYPDFSQYHLAVPTQAPSPFFFDNALYVADAWLGEGKFGITWRVSTIQTPIVSLALKCELPIVHQNTTRYREGRNYEKEAGIHKALGRIAVTSGDPNSRSCQHFLLMSWIEGITLNDFLDVAEQKPIALQRFPRINIVSSDEIIRVWILTVAAVHHLHQLGHVHRDLHGGNVMVSFDLSNAQLIDFGESKQKDALGPTYFPFEQATAYHIAPECFRSDKQTICVRPAEDHYAAGHNLKETLVSYAMYPENTDKKDALANISQQLKANHHAERMPILDAIQQVISICFVNHPQTPLAQQGEFFLLSCMILVARLKSLSAIARLTSTTTFNATHQHEMAALRNILTNVPRPQSGANTRETNTHIFYSKIDAAAREIPESDTLALTKRFILAFFPERTPAIEAPPRPCATNLPFQ